jgi:type II secretory pathway component HofQ
MTRARTVLLVAALLGLTAGPAWALKVGRISLESSQGRLVLKIQTDGEAHAKLQLLKGKVLVVIPGGERSLATLKLGGDPVKRIRFGRDGGDLHVVLDLSRPVKASLGGQDATGIRVDLGPAREAKGPAADAKPAAEAPADAKPAADGAVDALNPALAGYTSRIVDVALDGDDAHSELVISADGPASYKPMVKEGGRLFSVLFRNSALAWSGDAGKLKDNAIESVALHQLNEGGEAQVRLDVHLSAKLDYAIQRDQNQLVLRFVRPAKAEPEPKQGDLNTPVSLDVQDADLVSVLKALCDQAGFEYQFTPGLLAVSPPNSLVTIKVLHRPFSEVANTLLVGVKANFVQQGNSLIFGMQADVDAAKAELPVVQRVYVPKNITVAQALKLLLVEFKRADQTTLATQVAAADPRDTTRLLLSGSAEDVAQVMQGLLRLDVGDNGDGGGDSEPGDNAMRTQVYIIRYVSLASGLIQASIMQLFPPSVLADADNKPQILSDDTTHSLVITTQMKYHRKIQKLINRLDVRPLQVNIEGKIVEVDENVSQQLGIDWNGSSTSQAPVGYNPAGTIAPGPNTTGNFNTNAQTDFTSALTFATLQNGYNIAARIQALINESKADLVSAPNITTNDEETALISSTDNVVIQTTTTTFSNGASQSTVTSSQLPLELQLLVQPRVAKEDRRIYMAINFQLQSQTGNAPAGSSLPPTSTQQAQTRVNVASGETAVIGGMVRQSVTSTEGKVPVLGDIPLLGMLFRFKSDAKVKREVIIFITPSIVED